MQQMHCKTCWLLSGGCWVKRAEIKTERWPSLFSDSSRLISAFEKTERSKRIWGRITGSVADVCSDPKFALWLEDRCPQDALESPTFSNSFAKTSHSTRGVYVGIMVMVSSIKSPSLAWGCSIPWRSLAKVNSQFR